MSTIKESSPKFVEENKVIFMQIFREPMVGENRYIGKYKYHL